MKRYQSTINEIVVGVEVTGLMEKTLRELCDEMNISRRAIQGYENEGLVYPSGKTDRGYLLYDEEAQKKIQTIRFYQELGFSRKKIAFLLDVPKEILKEEMKQKREELFKQKDKIEILIKIVEEIIA